MQMVKYTTEKLLARAKEIIPEHNLIFVEDVIAMLGVSVSTFYDKIPGSSEEMEILRALLDKNKIDLKVSMRKKWSESDHPTLQIALYRLASNTKEHRLLNPTYTGDEQTEKEKEINVNLTLTMPSDDTSRTAD